MEVSKMTPDKNNGTGSRLREDVLKLFDCFLIVIQDKEKVPKVDFTFPTDFGDKEILHQAPLFCFPYKSNQASMPSSFTFILTDIEGKHRFGFCKLVPGNICYCFLSFLPWFEIFYKILNYIRELNLRNKDEILRSVLSDIYDVPFPINQPTFKINMTLSIKVPESNALPSIPENRNLSEYFSAVTSAFMMDIFASLMIERRIIFTSNSLCKLTSCVLGAEALLHPLHWQHIFIPVMPPHLVDYCLAPMPYVIGIHSSLMEEVRKMLMNDSDVVIADIDDQQIESNFDDIQHIPHEVVSFLKSNLRKKGTVIGTGLAETFMKTQARLIGGYRNGLKFQAGQPILFDEDVFVDFYKSNTAQEFARVLVQLQSFKQFVDGRLEMLNGGVGFRDDFENEINNVSTWEFSDKDVYKEWMLAAKKGGNEFLTQMKKKAKGAKASLRALNTPQKTIASPHITPLDEKTQNIRPKRPPPINLSNKNEPRPSKPPRPPLPAKFKNSKRVIRRYSTLVLDDPVNSEENVIVKDVTEHDQGDKMRERTLSDPFHSVDVDLMSDMEMAFDKVSTGASQEPTPTKTNDFLLDLSTDQQEINKPEPRNRNSQASVIRRSAHVNSRPDVLKFKDYQPAQDSLTSSDDDILDGFVFAERPKVNKPSYNSSNDLAGLVFDNNTTKPISQPQSKTTSQYNNWAKFDDIRTKQSLSRKPDKKVNVLPVNFSMASSSEQSMPSYSTGPITPSGFTPSNQSAIETRNNGLIKPIQATKTYSSPVVGQINSNLLLSTPATKPNNFIPRSYTNSTTAYKNKNAASFQRNYNNADTSPINRSYTVSSKPTIPVRPHGLNLNNLARTESLRPMQDGSNEMFSDLLNTWKSKEGL